VSEVHQVFRLGLEVHAAVQQDREAVPRWERRRERRTLDARQQSPGLLRRQDGGAGVPCAEDRRRLASRDGLDGDPDRRPALAAQHGRRRVDHLDDGVGVEQLDVEPARGVPTELARHVLARSNE